MDGGSNYSLSLKLKNPLNQKEAHYAKNLSRRITASNSS